MIFSFLLLQLARNIRFVAIASAPSLYHVVGIHGTSLRITLNEIREQISVRIVLKEFPMNVNNMNIMKGQTQSLHSQRRLVSCTLRVFKNVSRLDALCATANFICEF